jgi:putative flippase GtrA
MKALVRWGRFNLVGALGMGVQLAVIALLTRLIPRHLLFASWAAVEITLLHNFAWHWHYTWSDRRCEISGVRAMVRFHLSNGVVSMAGNLVLMHLLVRREHVPVLLASCIAILCCSLVNFFLGNGWVFAESPQRVTLYTYDMSTSLFRSP